MFEENAESFTWRCDTCNLAVEFPPLDFWRSLGELKARGWRITRDREDREWVHYCGKCWRKHSATNVTEFLNRKAAGR